MPARPKLPRSRRSRRARPPVPSRPVRSAPRLASPRLAGMSCSQFNKGPSYGLSAEVKNRVSAWGVRGALWAGGPGAQRAAITRCFEGAGPLGRGGVPCSGQGPRGAGTSPRCPALPPRRGAPLGRSPGRSGAPGAGARPGPRCAAGTKRALPRGSGWGASGGSLVGQGLSPLPGRRSIWGGSRRPSLLVCFPLLLLLLLLPGVSTQERSLGLAPRPSLPGLACFLLP